MEDSWAIKMADDLMLDMADGEKQWSFENLSALGALMRLCKRDIKYFNFCKKYIDELINGDYGISGIDPANYDIDIFAGGRILINLYKETNEKKYKRAAERLYRTLLSHPKSSDGILCLSSDKKPLFSIEYIYAAEPFYCEAIKLFEQKRSYDNVIRQFLLCSKYLKDETSGLFRHFYDEDNKTDAKCVWGGASGFFGAALADTLNIISEKIYDRRYLKEMAVNYSNALINAQDKESGCWYNVMNSPERKGNYIEAEASCLALYFLCAVFRMNLLYGDRLVNAINNGCDGIIDEFCTISCTSRIILNKCCLTDNNIDGDLSYSAYISRPIVSNLIRAKAAFVMAMNEYDRIKDRLRR